MTLSREEYKKSYIDKYGKDSYSNSTIISKKISYQKLIFNSFFLFTPLVFALSLDFLFLESKIMNPQNSKNNNFYYMKNLDSFKKIEDINFNTSKISLMDFNKKTINNKLDKIIKVAIKPKPIKEFNFEIPQNIDEKKIHFIKVILPKVFDYNKKILGQRQRLEEINNYLNTNKTLNKNNQKYIKNLAINYNVEYKNKHKVDIINELLLRVDIIPNSIVIAQAANESGWGTSRFAKDYNALFGEYTYDFSDGVVPLLREEGEKHLVKSFDSVNKSVQSYFNNLNSHYAYKDFREVRKIMREKNNFSNLKLLIEELDSYAADVNYIKTINSIIDANQFNKFDSFNYSINNS